MMPLTKHRGGRREPRHLGPQRKRPDTTLRNHTPEHAARISAGHLRRWEAIRAERRAAGLPETAEQRRQLAIAQRKAEREARRAEKTAERQREALARRIAPEQYTPCDPDDPDSEWRPMTLEERTPGYWEAVEAAEAAEIDQTKKETLDDANTSQSL